MFCLLGFGQERIADAIEHGFLERVVARPVPAGVKHVLARQIVARHAGIVGRDDIRHVGMTIEQDRVRFVLDAEDELVAGEIDLDGNPACAHLAQQARRIALVGDIDAMADTAGARHLDGFAHMTLQPFGRHHAERQLAGMEAEPHVGELLLEESEHAHVQAVVAHRHVPVLGSEDVHAHHPAAGTGGGERGIEAREHRGRRQIAHHIGLEANLEIGVVDAIIEPTVTRTALARAISQAPQNRGSHGNIPL